MVVPPYFEVPPRAYGGVESVVADLTDALMARGHEVTLIGAGEQRTGTRFVPVWPRPVPERLGEPFPEVVHAALVRRVIQRLAARSGLDIVHDHTLAGPLNAPAYAALGLPTVVTMHGPVNQDLHQLYSALRDDIHLVAISERQRQLAPELNWAGMVHNAVRVETFPFRADKGDHALFLGRFHPEKAPHLALEAAHAVGMPLILAGKCAEPIEKEYFEREVRPRLTDQDVVFGVADAEAKRRLLAEARCLLFPVRWEEPFGMVMIEAMACGTPVVALRGGAVPEVVVDGVTGYVCDEPDQLPDALRRLSAIDPAACRQRVVEHFDVGRLGAGYEAAYRKVLARADAGTDSLRRLRREYGELDAALDRRYSRTRRRHSGATHSRTAADRTSGLDRVSGADRTAGKAAKAGSA
ncbi:glycosyltransferase family 4 protein [Micromonospora sp. HM5-17]|uniref:glycosyltransferase family 4 protein n=1 Tax=Micromonospora sp. HM5-17 TaxID=2487710 RepID=UPI000F497E86|nr:glycosyltransferase family 4 protein [Micromonospora sp. HM5-17]ROT33400.1 glycosyltransferase family 4 protein [Micromonospora sp. HM5-17]